MTDWAEVMRLHGPLVWRTVARLLSHPADADDCFQQCFLAAVELDRRTIVRHWPAVLKRIATARALDRLRERYRHAERVTGPADDLPDGTAGALAMAADAELAESLRRALTRMDPRQAEAFALVAVEGLSYAETADALGTTANHVGVLLHRAKAALRSDLVAFAPTGDRP
jgi:RNA polymerase sigma-70 factor (ECF subfamily)